MCACCTCIMLIELNIYIWHDWTGRNTYVAALRKIPLDSGRESFRCRTLRQQAHMLTAAQVRMHGCWGICGWN